MKPLWYLILIVLFIICSPNAFFRTPIAWRNLDRTAVVIIHSCIFAGLWYILYDTEILRVLLSGPTKNKPSSQQKIQHLELSPDTPQFTHRLGDGSK